MARHPRHLLIVFARYPTPGQVKTRLIPALGEKGAAEAHERMAHAAFAAARALRPTVEVEVRFADGETPRVAEWVGPGVAVRPQKGTDLGDRMHNAFLEGFSLARGYRRIVIIGTDCPYLHETLIARAFDRLRQSDLVLGPALDGGYYLIGLRAPCPGLFHNVDWGGPDVLTQTLRNAARERLRVRLLAPLPDVDRPSDLSGLRRYDTAIDAGIDVVIPTLNEQSALPATLERVSALKGVTVIVADGGSTDRTAHIAREHGATVIDSPPGRARQMNLAARAGNAPILLFLHADTLLPDGWPLAVRRTLIPRDCIGGAFDIRLDAPGSFYRGIERLIALRHRLWRMPYGDQALFCRREVFRRVGGYPEVPIMEDVELVQRLRRQGRLALLPQAVTTSARRWRADGPLRTTLAHQAVLLAWASGLDAQKIARLRKR